MKYVSIDIETTGLNFENNQVLSIGAIVENTATKLPYKDLPKFYGIIVRKEITGTPTAITMNKNLIDQISIYNNGDDVVKASLNFGSKMFYQEDEIIPHLFRFLFKNGFGYDLFLNLNFNYIDSDYYPIINEKTRPIEINAAGKNFGSFDKLFLERLPYFKQLIKVNHRSLDPAILCCDWLNDESLPSLNECKKRNSISGEITHNALDDAWDVIQVLRKFY